MKKFLSGLLVAIALVAVMVGTFTVTSSFNQQNAVAGGLPGDPPVK